MSIQRPDSLIALDKRESIRYLGSAASSMVRISRKESFTPLSGFPKCELQNGAASLTAVWGIFVWSQNE
jgi:hypothetical protein